MLERAPSSTVAKDPRWGAAPDAGDQAWSDVVGRVRQLGYIGLNVSDVEAWERFAADILGLAPNGRDSDGSLYLRMDEYHHRFQIEPGAQDDLGYAGWEVADEQSLNAVAARLEAAGFPVALGSAAERASRRVVGLVTCQDPNGIRTEIFYGAAVSFEIPFTSPRPISGFVTGSLGLGHITIGVDDMDETVRFYRDLLELRISDYAEFRLATGRDVRSVFLRANSRHHSVGFSPKSFPKRMNHFMLQMRSLDDVGLTYDLCEERGVPIILGLGRHTNDQMVSFYLQTPSGFFVEYGWGAREVDDATWRVQKHYAGSIWGHRPVKARDASVPPVDP